MNARKIKEGIYWMGAVDWDRRLFDSLIPLPHGTSYNAYLVQGTERVALIDSADPAMRAELLAQLNGVERVDYVVCNHVEQDHSGCIPDVLAKYPQARVVCSVKGKGMAIEHLGLAENRIQAVADGETLPLGGKTLKFVSTPWVHWPETMSTYLVEDRLLCSCDFFGSHLATSDLFVTDEALVYESAKRYYAEIMMPFRSVVRTNIDKVCALPLDLIAPSHGPLYPRPAFIIDAYRDWVADQPRNLVVLPYVSMHGSTERMVRHLVGALAEREVKVAQFDLAATDLGQLAINLVDAATLVIGTPAVHVGPHPAVFYAAHLANALRPKLKFAAIIGSYGWGHKISEQVAALISNLKVEILDGVICRGFPRAADLQALTALAGQIAAKHQALNLR
jgi:flavorubredoxin